MNDVFYYATIYCNCCGRELTLEEQITHAHGKHSTDWLCYECLGLGEYCEQQW